MQVLKQVTIILTTMATTILVVLEATATITQAAILTIFRMVTPTLQAITITTTFQTTTIGVTATTTVTQEWETARSWKGHLEETIPAAAATMVTFNKFYYKKYF